MPFRKDIPPARLRQLIPFGDYCYSILPDWKQTSAIGRRIKPCPFYAGQRPMDCYCGLYRGPQDGLFNVDATKSCGINEPAEADYEWPDTAKGSWPI
jgi:hypothetical protein